MSETAACPKCGAHLPDDAPAGLCPKCLVKAGFESDGQADPQLEPTAASPTSSAWEPPSAEALAERFPQLDILQILGKGGMGAVYKARQPELDRLVAVKILPPEVGSDPAFTERFTREARALAKLSHQNIVTIFDFGQADGLYYFVMEFVDGVNLRETMRADKLRPQEVLSIVTQICDALQFAHDEGVVHRDIKPENILLDRKGRIKIADFGLAKLIGKAPADVSLTGTHQAMGTLHYMAPEQMERPLEVDHRADIYSLGVVFYEMLTGELPIGRFAPPSKKVQLDVRLDEVVFRTLEKEPERRYQHASDVKTDVETIATGGQPPSPPANSLWSFWTTPQAGFARWVGVPILILLGLWILAVVAVFWRYGGRENYQQGPILLVLSGGPGLLFLAFMGLTLLWAANRERKTPTATAAAEAVEWQVKRHAVVLMALGIITLLIPLAIPWGDTMPVGRDQFGNSWSDLAVALVAAHAVGISAALLMGGLMVFAALNMIRMEWRRLAVAGTILAMIVPPGCLIGLPAGILALRVLSRQKVKDAFKAAHPPDWRLNGTLSVLIWTMFLSLVAIAIHMSLWPYDHFAPANYTIGDDAWLLPQSGAYYNVHALSSGKGRTQGPRPSEESLRRQQLTFTMYSKPDLGRIEIDLRTLGYRYWDRAGAEVTAESGLSEKVLLQWISSTGVYSGGRAWAAKAATGLRFAQTMAEEEGSRQSAATFRTFVPNSNPNLEYRIAGTDQLVYRLYRPSSGRPQPSGKIEIALGTLGYHYRDREGREVSSDSGLSEEVLLDWLKSSGVDTDSPAVRAEAANLLEIANGAARQRLDELANPVTFMATGSPYSHDSECEVTPDKWIVPAVGAFWLIVWLGGCGLCVVRGHRKSCCRV